MCESRRKGVLSRIDKVYSAITHFIASFVSLFPAAPRTYTNNYNFIFMAAHIISTEMYNMLQFVNVSRVKT